MSTTKTYDLHLKVIGPQKLATIISLLDGEAQLVKVTEVLETPMRVPPVYRGGHRNKGIKGSTLLSQILADGHTHRRENITSVFEAHNFSPNSASPVISVAIRDGLAIETDDGIRLRVVQG